MEEWNNFKNESETMKSFIRSFKFKRKVGIVLIFLSSFIPFSLSNGQDFKKSKAIDGISKTIDTVGNTVTSVMDANTKSQLAMINSQNQQRMMSQLQPQMADQRTLKMFPACPRPASNPAIPKGACSSVGDQNSLMQANFFKNLANQYSEFYDYHLSTSQDSPQAVGLKCIEDSSKKLESDLVEKANTLQGLMDLIKKNQQRFAEENETLKRQMKLLNIELNGGTSNDIDTKNTDYTKFFPGCSGIIPQSALVGPKRGLYGIRDSMNSSGMRKQSQDFVTNQGLYEKDIEKTVEKMMKDLSENGIADWIEGGATPTKWSRGGTTQFKGMDNIIQEEVRELQLARKRIEKDLKKFNYVPPRFDKNFADNFNDFASGAQEYFKREYINNCATKSGDVGAKGLGMDKETILKGIVNTVNKSGGTTSRNYKKSVSEILDSDDFLEDKILELKKLDRIYGEGTLKVKYLDGNTSTAYDTVYDLLTKSIQNCEKEYKHSNVFSKNKGKIESQAKKAKKAQASLNELSQLYRTFTSKLATAIKDKVKYCSGSQLKEGSCSPNSLNPSSPGFCISHASQCAVKTRSCYQQADNFIKDRTNKLKASQLTYNKRVEDLVANQENFLAGIKSQVAADSAYLKAFFPGANFILPPELAVAMPAPADSPYGVQLRGGGSLSFLKNLPEQIKKLQKALLKQGDKAMLETKDFMNKQEKIMKDNKAKFEQLSENCSKAMAAFQEKSQKSAGEQAKAMGEQGQKTGEFCLKYNRLRNTNPAAGCDGDNSPSALYDEAIKISAQLNNSDSIMNKLGAYERVCAQSQNEAKLGTEDKEEEPTPLLIKECKKTGYNWDQVMNRRQQSLLSEISNPELRKKVGIFLNSNKISNDEKSDPSDPADKEELNSPSPDVAFNGPLGDRVQSLNSLRNQVVDTKSRVVKDLNGKQPTKEEVKISEVIDKIDSNNEQLEKFFPQAYIDIRVKLSSIEKNMATDKKKARGDLEIIIAKKDEILGKETDEAKKVVLGEIFDSLKKAHEESSDENLKELPALPPSGVGSKHENEFMESKGKNDVCAYLKNKNVEKSISECEQEDNFTKCYNNAVEKNSKTLPIGSLLHAINSNLERVAAKVNNAPSLSRNWARIGEGSSDVCNAQASSATRDELGEKGNPAETIPDGSMDNSYGPGFQK